MAYLALMTHAPLTIVVNRIDQGMSSLILLSVPLFVFLGVLIEMTEGKEGPYVSYLHVIERDLKQKLGRPS